MPLVVRVDAVGCCCRCALRLVWGDAVGCCWRCRLRLPQVAAGVICGVCTWMVADAVVSRRRWSDEGNRGGRRGKKKEKGKGKRERKRARARGGTCKRRDMC